MRLSIIVPVYNTAPYLKECFDSLLSQTLPEIEFIIVNDGSTDNSLHIIRQYAQQYPQFKVIDQSNQGYSGARNTALACVTGSYVGFVDSDDYIAPDMFEKLFRQAQLTKADIVSCSFYRFYQKKTKRTLLLDSNELFVRLLAAPRGNASCNVRDYGELLLDHAFVWNRIYKTEFLKNNQIKFPTDIFFGEDTYFHRLALLHAQHISYIPQPLYYYRQGRNGSQSFSTARHNLSFILNCQKLYAAAKALNLTSLNPWMNHLVLSLGAWGYERIAPEYRDEYYQRFSKLISQLPTPFPIAYPNCKHTGLMIQARYLLLRILHPLLYRSLKKNRRLCFNIVMQLRIFFQTFPQKLSYFLRG